MGSILTVNQINNQDIITNNLNIDFNKLKYKYIPNVLDCPNKYIFDIIKYDDPKVIEIPLKKYVMQNIDDIHDDKLITDGYGIHINENIFIPRTLYELYFIEQLIKELLLKNNNWRYKKIRKWGYSSDKIEVMIQKLNQIILSDIKQSLTFGEIKKLMNQKLNFLFECHQNSDSQMHLELKEIRAKINWCFDFIHGIMYEHDYGSSKPFGIANDSCRSIIEKAITLECSHTNCYILYRGSILNDDSIISEKYIKDIYSLSYGMGLFAGCVYDIGACAFHYMRKNYNDAFAVVINKGEDANGKEVNTPFAIPDSHPLCQIFGGGEEFHARTKAYNDGDRMYLKCSSASLGKIDAISNHYKTLVNKETYQKEFEDYMINCVYGLK